MRDPGTWIFLGLFVSIAASASAVSSARAGASTGARAVALTCTRRFPSVPEGRVEVRVTPYLGYTEQAANVTLSANTVLDFSLSPLPVRVIGELRDARTEARPPRCTGLIEAIDGPDAGRKTSPTVGMSFEFTGLFQPGTVTFRYSAPGGYETKVRSVRLRGLSTGNTTRAGTSLECPNCPSYSSMTCP